MELDFLKTLTQVINQLDKNNRLSLRRNNLCSISKNRISIPVGNIFPFLQNYKSKLNDKSVVLKLYRVLMNSLYSSKSIIRLNHIGFCYKTESQEQEKLRLIGLTNKTKSHLYQEQSNDEGIWLFLGDTSDWEKPMVELVPVEKTIDPYVDYWLPHIHIDMDTKLTASEIKNVVKTIFGKSFQPHSISIDGTVYIVRNRLGIVDGINIFLDLATNSRNVKYLREKLLKKISI
jgi:hypothetical protein